MRYIFPVLSILFFSCVEKKKPMLEVIQSIEISKGLYWSGDFEKVTRLITDEKINQTEIRFFLGYSGWDINQLQSELSSNTWILSENIHKDNIIQAVDTAFWKKKMLALGGEYSLWSNAPEDPSYN